MQFICSHWPGSTWKLQMQVKGNIFNMELIKLKTYLLSLHLKTTTWQKISFIYMCLHSLPSHPQRILRNSSRLPFPLPNSFSGQTAILRICNGKLNHYLKKKDYSFYFSVSKVWHEIFNTQTTIKTYENFCTVTYLVIYILKLVWVDGNTEILTCKKKQ